MARIKLELPEFYVYSTELQVRITDINYGGHLGNDALLGFLHEARCRFLHKQGYSELDVEGIGLIMTDVVVVYKTEAFFPETVRLDLALTDFSRCGFDFFYRLTGAAHGREVARAKTGIVFFDYEHKKVQPVPAAFSCRFAGG